MAKTEMETADGVQRSIETVWRMESARIIARLARYTGDLGAAEDLAQDALLAALEQWPRDGVPDQPAAWLTTVAKRKAIDAGRRASMHRDREDQIALEVRPADLPIPEVDEPIKDDLLRLIFTCCHPVLNRDARVALTLRILGGLTTEEIARAFLLPVPTLAQRIVRAKKTLKAANVPYEAPTAAELPERLPAVLEVIYLIFNEGYTASSGNHWYRGDLCWEGVRMARIVVGLMPDEPEVHGLCALLELQASRLKTRVDSNGEPILLLDQDRSRWDRLLINRGFAGLRQGDSLSRSYGPYMLQAAIAACHAQANRPEHTNWSQIAALYEALAAIVPSPVIELNRAVAVSMAYGPEAGLEIVDALVAAGELANYHLLPSVRGDLLERMGRSEEAAAEYRTGAEQTGNEREKALLLRRAEQADGKPMEI